MARLKVGLIFGGKSDEHEVSLRSAREVWSNLSPEKYEIIPIAITKNGEWLVGDKGARYMEINLPKAGKVGGVAQNQSDSPSSSNSGLSDLFQEDIDLIFPIGHGAYIEDGRLPGMLDMLGISYLFSGTLASSLAMDKQKTKLVAKNTGLKVAKEVLLQRGKKYDAAKIIKKIGLPVVVKPVDSGSSVGVTICREEAELENAISKAFQCGSRVMLEQFIKGRELTVAVMGDESPKALPVIEIIPKVASFFSYEAKYQAGGSVEICPADIPDEVRKKVQRYAVKIFKALGCSDLSRADFIWNEENDKTYFLEINIIPGMTSTSLAPQAAKAAGLSFPEFLDRLIQFAIKRKNSRK
jgi:D-alanine-D-alanine ligase